ncbi:syncytin-1-like [Ursus maritimus]|uniref:Syncytin-1-like n=1 Tax=Ursus maritimus TaxID=29073 RepID=A0A8M1FHP2_URSMA|nr:syncytin-1-like [Ursus maritimus]
MTGPLRWWALPNFAWYGLLPLVLLSPLTQATECGCMRGSGRTRYFQSFTYMPSKCYAGKSPYTCTSVHAPGRTFWMSDLTERYSHPCDTYPKTGKVCWTYLAQIGLSDGGGVQDQAGCNQTQQIVRRLHEQLQAQAYPTYKGINLDSIQKVPTTEQLTVALLNSSYNLWRNVSQDRYCWICFPFSTLSNIVGIPIPTQWPLPNSTINNKTVHIRPIGGTIPILNLSSTIDTLTPRTTNITSSLPYCTPSGVFLSCPKGIYCCLTTNDSLDWAGLITGVATGAAGLGTSIYFYYKLSQALNDDMERIADSLTALQTQVTSLAAIALQNRRALDLLTPEKGGTCLYLNEECCYFVNQSGIVTSKIRELKDRIRARCQDNSIWGLDPHTWVTWLLPLAGPLCLILLLISVAPCLIWYIQERLREVTLVSVNQLLLQPYSRLPTSDCPYDNARPSAGSSQNEVDAPPPIPLYKTKGRNVGLAKKKGPRHPRWPTLPPR